MASNSNKMKQIKVLNLYAGIGGNRKLWTNVDVTAVEIDPKIAEIYQDFFPDDKVIVGDAHQYLLDHYKEFDFIWASPPCPTHSRLNFPMIAKGINRYIDMKLWQEIIFLKWNFKGVWVVENVITYYEPLIKPKLIGRHYYWSNFIIPKIKEHINDDIAIAKTSVLEKHHNIDLSKYNFKDKRLLLRNAVNPQHGLHIFNMAFKEKQLSLEIAR